MRLCSKECERLRAENAMLREHLREIATCTLPAWQPDERVGYVDVQITLPAWKELQALLTSGALDPRHAKEVG